MFTTLTRAPRRTAFIGLVGGLVAIMLLIMLKDMNEKLTVMTASNQAYQRMTDQQLDKINKLQVNKLENLGLIGIGVPLWHSCIILTT